MDGSSQASTRSRGRPSRGSRVALVITLGVLVLGATAVAGLGAVGSGERDSGRADAPEPAAFGLDDGDLPPGYALVGPGVIDTEGASAEGGAVLADVYELADGGTAAVLTGPSDALESFLPAASTGDLDLGDRVVAEYGGLREPGRVVLGVRSTEEGGWDAVVISDLPASQLGSVVAAVASPPDQRPGTLLASGDLDALAGLLPGSVGTYAGAEPADQITVATYHGAELDPVLREVVSLPEDVEVNGVSALAFSGEVDRQFVAWSPLPGELVVLVGPDALSRADLVALAQQVHEVEPVVVPGDVPVE